MDTETVPARDRRNSSRLLALAKLCRLHQWTKNVFVLAPLLFSLRLTDGESVYRAFLATGCFCLLSSAVYAFNDLLDAEADRDHPRKGNRPIAAGQVSPVQALGLIGLLLATAGALGAAFLPGRCLVLMAAYLVNSVVYCVWLKHKVILDVMSIASGFVLRLLAGCAAVSVGPTSWIMVCGFALALVLGFGKRRTELAHEISSEHRRALRSYNPAKLDMLQSISTTACLVTYMLYTVAPETVQRHRTENLIYTIPIVAYALFRYLFKTAEGKGGDGPAEVLLNDWVFMVSGILWVLAVAVIIIFL